MVSGLLEMGKIGLKGRRSKKRNGLLLATFIPAE